MKKINIIFALFFGIIINGFSQTTVPVTDFFAGKWEITVIGSPRGDMIFNTNLVRKDAKLTGELSNETDKRVILRTEETATKLVIYFESSQGGEVKMELDKVDDNTLKGYVMDTYEATAKRGKAEN